MFEVFRLVNKRAANIFLLLKEHDLLKNYQTIHFLWRTILEPLEKIIYYIQHSSTSNYSTIKLKCSLKTFKNQTDLFIRKKKQFEAH